MINLAESYKYGTAHGKLDDLLDRMLLGQEYGNIQGYIVIVVDGEVHMSKVYFEVWVIWLAPLKDIDS